MVIWEERKKNPSCYLKNRCYRGRLRRTCQAEEMVCKKDKKLMYVVTMRMDGWNQVNICGSPENSYVEILTPM